jgi:hypothetical protein
MTETGASTFILTSTFTTFTAPSKIQGSVSEPFDNNNNESVLLTTAEWSNFIIDGTGEIISQGLAESRRIPRGRTDSFDTFPGGTDSPVTDAIIGNHAGMRCQFLYLPGEISGPVATGGGILTGLGWRHMGPVPGLTTDPTPGAGLLYNQHLTIRLGHASSTVTTSETLGVSCRDSRPRDARPPVPLRDHPLRCR